MQRNRKLRPAAGHPASRRRAQGAAATSKRRSSRGRWRPSSPAKIQANRRNGCKSRGPLTKKGKFRSSRNALRHGLAAFSRHAPECLPEIERMAKALCKGDTDPWLFEQALIIAETDYILRCVRSQRLAAIERMRDPQQAASGPGASEGPAARSPARL